MDVLQAARSLLGNLSFLEPSHSPFDRAEEPRRLPWSAAAHGEQPYERLFRDRILQLSRDETKFLTGAANYMAVDIEFALAGNALQDDPNLRQLRFKLVPKHISEEKFWRVYFAKVAEIKEEVMAGTDTAESGFIYLPSTSQPEGCEGVVRGGRAAETAEPADCMQLEALGRSDSMRSVCGQERLRTSADPAGLGVLQCNSQASSITEAMLMSPRSPTLESQQMDEEASGSLRHGEAYGLSGSSAIENEDSQFAKLEDGEEDDESTESPGLPQSTWASAYSGWVLL